MSSGHCCGIEDVSKPLNPSQGLKQLQSRCRMSIDSGLKTSKSLSGIETIWSLYNLAKGDGLKTSKSLSGIETLALIPTL